LHIAQPMAVSDSYRLTICVWKTLKYQGIDSCQGNVRKLTKSQGNARELWIKNLVQKNLVLLTSRFDNTVV